MSRRRYPRTAVVGAGRLARSLVPVLTTVGYPIVSVAARRLASARRLSRDLPGALATIRPEKAATGARLVLLAVPDREISGVARRLAKELEDGWSDRTVLHHAGSLGIEPLAPLGRAGAAVGVLHPLQCLGHPQVAARVLPGSRARIEGDRRGRVVARRLALDLGLVPLPLPGKLKPADRAAYHAAASMGANDLLALFSLASDLLESLGLSRREAVKALIPLAHGTLAHVEAMGFESALTGPVPRGDAGTTRSQLRRIARQSKDGARVHRLLSLRLLELAEESGTLSGPEKRELRRVLKTGP